MRKLKTADWISMGFSRHFTRLLICLLALGSMSASTAAQDADTTWPDIESAARGQSVHWYAWAGDARINDYIEWAAAELDKRYGIDLEHVRIDDTAQAVTRILTEQAAGRDSDGAVDLIWINGENFARLHGARLLHGPWVDALPNWRLVNTADNPVLTRDATMPIDGHEMPWGLAQLTFYHDSERLPTPPADAGALLDWLARNPGRFTFPQPPDFLGTAFLKQLLHGMLDDPAVLQHSPTPAQFETLTRPLWDYLDRLVPQLWRRGQQFPRTAAQSRQLLADAEIDMAISFNPHAVSHAIALDELPDTVRPFPFSEATLANASYLAIPYNASARQAAMVVSNFLLSPEAQARKARTDIWGSPTVLSLSRLTVGQRALFPGKRPGLEHPALPEPHPDWTRQLDEAWQRRYGARH